MSATSLVCVLTCKLLIFDDRRELNELIKITFLKTTKPYHCGVFQAWDFYPGRRTWEVYNIGLSIRKERL